MCIIIIAVESVDESQILKQETGIGIKGNDVTSSYYPCSGTPT